MDRQAPIKHVKRILIVAAIMISFLGFSVFGHIGALAEVVEEKCYCEADYPYDDCECIDNGDGNESGNEPDDVFIPELGDNDETGSGGEESGNQDNVTEGGSLLRNSPGSLGLRWNLETGLLDVPTSPDPPSEQEREPEDGSSILPTDEELESEREERESIRQSQMLNPSREFIDLANRTRFHVDSQIEGLPPFINMEMIVGVLRAQDTYGFPASVAIAQIIQEGGYGTYGPGGELGLGLSRLSFHYNNLFGIKGVGPAGSVSMRTFEMTPTGETYFINDYFRVYNTFTDSIMDRSQLLLEEYSDLIYGVTNANEFAWNIASRWATDINYANSLIRHMEVYDLYRLDEMTLYDYHDLIGAGRFIHPVPGSTITSVFGWRPWDNAYHRGIDFGTGVLNLPIYAAESGVVTFVGYGVTAGNWIAIYHGNGLYTKYMHNFANFVEVGQRVERGQQIALTGNTGNSTGNHLHFEVHLNGQAINPILLLGFGF